MKPKLLAIVGPTSIGKTDLGVQIAKLIDGEIVGADSRQIYRYMDLGTGKPTSKQRMAIPYHLIDIVDPDEPFSLAVFLDHAKTAVDDICSRSKIPVLVGGTGQYVWGFLEGWNLPRVPPNAQLRKNLESLAVSEGVHSLHKELATLDPGAAERIDPRNIRRVVRALEVKLSGTSDGRDSLKKIPIDYDVFILGLTTDRKTLFGRIDSRVDRMIETGWIDEVVKLIGMGYHSNVSAMSGIGYRELIQHIEGEVDVEEAVSRTKYRTHRFARQQYAWFSHSDQRISWFDIDAFANEVPDRVLKWCRPS